MKHKNYMLVYKIVAAILIAMLVLTLIAGALGPS